MKATCTYWERRRFCPLLTGPTFETRFDDGVPPQTDMRARGAPEGAGHLYLSVLGCKAWQTAIATRLLQGEAPQPSAACSGCRGPSAAAGDAGATRAGTSFAGCCTYGMPKGARGQTRPHSIQHPVFTPQFDSPCTLPTTVLSLLGARFCGPAPCLLHARCCARFDTQQPRDAASRFTSAY